MELLVTIKEMYLFKFSLILCFSRTSKRESSRCIIEDVFYVGFCKLSCGSRGKHAHCIRVQMNIAIGKFRHFGIFLHLDAIMATNSGSMKFASLASNFGVYTSLKGPVKYFMIKIILFVVYLSWFLFSRCPTRKQNRDYAMYLLSVLYHESWVSRA